MYWLTRFYFLRGLAFIYVIGFTIIVRQYLALCGSDGILPVRLFLKRVDFWDAPSLFWLNSSDTMIMVMAWVGLLLSLLALSGLTDAYSALLSSAVWFVLWLIYLSFVNVGQTFYGFGWETLLLEIGFLAIFFGPSKAEPSVVVVWMLRWVLFRLMFGAGLIKIRGDSCWRDLTCMKYFYETQPMPNPLSWYFHHMPMWMHKGAVLINHFVELIVPFFFFGPRPVRHVAGILTILFQVTLILGGNLSWLNYVTIVVCLACFDDSILPILQPWFKIADLSWPVPVIETAVAAPVLYVLTAIVAVLSIRPAMNLFSSRQMMNSSFEPLHLVNTYGAFGSITRERDEVVIEGTDDNPRSPTATWKEYLFVGKPGEVDHRPPIVSPYHLRLDWQMWFAAMSDYRYHPWILNFIAKLLQGQQAVVRLLRLNPFPDHPPKAIRARLFRYHFTDSGPNWWERHFEYDYLPPLSLDNPDFRAILESQEWIEPEHPTGGPSDKKNDKFE